MKRLTLAKKLLHRFCCPALPPTYVCGRDKCENARSGPSLRGAWELLSFDWARPRVGVCFVAGRAWPGSVACGLGWAKRWHALFHTRDRASWGVDVRSFAGGAEPVLSRYCFFPPPPFPRQNYLPERHRLVSG
jgi:hypothetical protein